MSRQKQLGTVPELAVRALVRDAGGSYRVRNRDLPGSPDLANRRRKWAIFVHGCFWHAHSGCPQAVLPKRNREIWKSKLSGNRARDQRAARDLRRLGFRVLIVWECQTKAGLRLMRRIGPFLRG